MTNTEEAYCCRCGKSVPDGDSLPIEWEVEEDQNGNVVGVICDGCITGSEQQAMDEDVMESAEFLSCCSRCGVASPDGDPEEFGWRLFSDSLVCPGCETPNDIRRSIREIEEATARLDQVTKHEPPDARE